MTENANEPETLQVGLILFDDAEELDWVGPFEVFTMAAFVAGGKGPAAGLKVALVSERGGLVRGAKGLRVETDHSFADAPALDLLLVPGGFGTRKEMDNPALLDFLQQQAPGCQWITSVCTGSAVLARAGLAKGRRITSHWAYLPSIREIVGEGTEVLEQVRYVRDGHLVTSAGVSAGIDMALWLVGEIYGREHARNTQRAMEYDPAPPYTADV